MHADQDPSWAISAVISFNMKQNFVQNRCCMHKHNTLTWFDFSLTKLRWILNCITVLYKPFLV